MHIKTINLILTIYLYSNCVFSSDSVKEDIQSIALLRNLKSLEVTENFKNLGPVEGVVIIGSSSSGKTTLINELRKQNENIYIPKRYINRPIRMNEDLNESEQISREAFLAKIKTEEIIFYWVRKMENAREELYGFEKPRKNLLPVYSANNAAMTSLYLQSNPNMLILSVYAPEEIRKQRLEKRSPDLNILEQEYRVAAPDKEEAYRKSHLLIHNYGKFERAISKFDIVTLIRALPLLASKWGVIEDLGDHKIEYHSRLFDIMNHSVQFSDGKRQSFQYVRRSPGVRVLITNKDKSKILLTNEWRTEINRWDFRLPGGKLFESSKAYHGYLCNSLLTSIEEIGKIAAIKEVEEECGIELSPENVEYSYTSKAGATVEWDLLYYTASYKENYQLSHHSEEGERTLIQWISPLTILDLCLNRVINEDRTACFLMRFILNNIKLTF